MLIDEDTAVYPSLRTAKFVEVACSGDERSCRCVAICRR